MIIEIMIEMRLETENMLLTCVLDNRTTIKKITYKKIIDK
jgi:hypothetical protein